MLCKECKIMKSYWFAQESGLFVPTIKTWDMPKNGNMK
jgi:hypothetical protein